MYPGAQDQGPGQEARGTSALFASFHAGRRSA